VGIAFGQLNDYKQNFADLTMMFKPVTFDALELFFMGWRDQISQKL